MKKIYEQPMVELTKFDVEDIITASGDPVDPLPTTVDASTLSGEAATTAAANITGYDAIGVYNW